MIAPLGLKEIPRPQPEQPGESVRICGMRLVGGAIHTLPVRPTRARRRRATATKAASLCHFGNEKPIWNCG
jgi:hypothetical protein